MRQRVIQAGERGIYVSVMLFNGWSIEDKGLWGINPWLAHPFHRDNNINGIDGDPNNDDQGLETHALAVPAITALQEAYVRKVIDTVGDLENVLYEISNESGPTSTEWQYQLINVIKAYEATQPKQHPVGMTAMWPWPQDNRATANALLFASPADWISPAGEPFNRPIATGDKVILADTDHLCGICGDYTFVWRSVTQGENPLFMDVWDCSPWWYPGPCDQPFWPSLRQNLGDARRYVERMDLAAAVPRPELCSTLLCLVNPGREYLVYLPEGTVTIDLSDAQAPLTVEWFQPTTGATESGGVVTGGDRVAFAAPFAGDAVLYLYSGQPPTPAATLTPTVTPTPVSPTATATQRPPDTPTALPIATSTPTAMPTETPTAPPTPLATETPIETATPTATQMITATSTATSTPTVLPEIAGTIQGVITDEMSGTPLRRVRVRAYRRNGRGWEQVTMVQSNNLGLYQLTNLSPGTYRLRFALKNYRTEYYDGVSKLSAGRNLVVIAGTVTDNIDAALARTTTTSVRQVTIQDEATLRVAVTDQPSGELLPDAIVTLYQLSPTDGAACPTTQPAEYQTSATWFDEGAGAGLIDWSVTPGCWFGTVEAETHAPVISPVVQVSTTLTTLSVTTTPLLDLFLPIIVP